MPDEPKQLPDRPDLSVVYVLTTTGADVYSDMATISALSVRFSNPGIRIVIAIDPESARAIKDARHPLLEVIDELRVVESSYESLVHRNRDIKTRLYEIHEGPAFNLDADTLVRGSLQRALLGDVALAAVANHNGISPQEQLWGEDARIIAEMSWPVHLPLYINTGLIFYRPGLLVKTFYATWHAFWTEECKTTGRGRDQPSCYAALTATAVALKELSEDFNMQINMHDRWAGNAIVWHFYRGSNAKATSFASLTDCVRAMPIETLSQRVRHVMEMPFPWPNTDFISRRICRHLSPHRPPSPIEQWWLAGDTHQTIRRIGKSVMRRLMREFVRPE